MSTAEVSCLRERRIGVVTLNRPHRRNALTSAMDAEILRNVITLGADSGIDAIVIIGTGDAFCAGGDFERLAEVARAGGAAYAPESHLRYMPFLRIAKPIVAALNGATIGSGLALALHCDVRIAAPKAFIGAPFASLGLIAELGIPWHLAHMIGGSRTMEFLLSRRHMPAQEALAAGLVSDLLTADDFRGAALSYAEEMVHGADAHAIGVIKSQVWRAAHESLPESLAGSGVRTAEAIDRPGFQSRLRLRAEFER